MGDIERVDSKRGKRTYKSKREKPAFANLIPIAIDMLKSAFPENGESPSVTTILGALAKPALINWAAVQERKMIAALAGQLYERLYKLVDEPVPPDKFIEILLEEAGKGAHLRLLAKASNVGTEVHKRIEWEFKGELGLEREKDEPKLTTMQAVRAFKKWTDWRIQVKLKVIAIEKKLYSSIFGFGGTLDLLAEIQEPNLLGKLITQTVVLDFKTGKHIYAESFLQNMAYRMALQEEGIKTDGGWIVRLPKYEDDPEFDAQPVPDDPSLGTTFLALNIVYKWWEREHQAWKSKRDEHKKEVSPQTREKE